MNSQEIINTVSKTGCGCGNNGSVMGEVKWVEGKQGKALSVEGKEVD